MSDFNYGGIDFGGMVNQADTIQSQIEAATQGGKTLSQAQMLQLQMEMAKMQQVYGAMSAIISDVKTTSMSIIQKM